MIEIILRDDIKEYEPHPIFGFTYRQVITAIAIISAGVILGLGLTALGLPNTIMSLCVLAVGAGIGFLGLGKLHGLRAETYIKIWLENRQWKKNALFCPPQFSPVSERQQPAVAKLDKKIQKEIARDQAEAELEIEIANLRG